MEAVASTCVDFNREIVFGSSTYPYYARAGASAWSELLGRLHSLDNIDQYILVVDHSFPSHLIDDAQKKISSLGQCTVLTIPADETGKTLLAVERLSDQAVGAGHTRRSCVLALGGGLTGNVAGLFASLQYRGLPLVHMPTTFLAMTDSCLSLKQAVNTSLGKNLLGTFYPPAFVWSNLDYLQSLPRREIQAALGEIIKFVLSVCPDRIDDLARRLNPQGHYASYEDYLWFLDLSIAAKQRPAMSEDPHEKRDGLIHEYGHTFGHALEFLSSQGNPIPHGFAIGIGMVVEAHISRLLGLMDGSEVKAHIDLLRRNGAPTSIPWMYRTDELLAIMRHDNKRGYLPSRSGAVDMVLLHHLGQPNVTGDVMITQVDETVVRAAIEGCRDPQPAVLVV